MESSTDPLLEAVSKRHGNFRLLLKAKSAVFARHLRVTVGR